jgi:sarcosine oxidase subunit gamma
MADSPALRLSPLTALAASALPCPAAELKPAAAAAKFIFRGRANAVAAAGRAFGSGLPQTACRAETAGTRSALWLGPDEWLLIAPEDEAADIAAGFVAALAGLPHALVDVGHRSAGLEVCGPQAATVLNCGCPLDLDIGAFAVGMCARTVLAKAEIVLWRTAPDRFRIEVWRSFAAYVWGVLEEARREHR